MADHFLDDRRIALEEAFFQKEQTKALEALKAKAAKRERAEKYATLLGVTDSVVLDKLEDLGVIPETVAALHLVPLLHVAWADGALDERERVAVLQAAADIGVTQGTASYDLLASWLDTRPHAAQLETWTAYIQGLLVHLDTQHREHLRDDLVGKARKIAESTGGILGLVARVSTPEKKAIEELERAFVA